VSIKESQTWKSMLPILDNTGREFGNCLLVVENNSLGISILEKLQQKGYPNIYYSIKGTHEFIDPVRAQVVNNSVPGFTTSSKTRPLIVAKMEEFIRNKLITTYSTRLANEFKTFIWNNNRAEAMRSYHDDLVMALAIGCWVRDTALTVNKKKPRIQESNGFLDDTKHYEAPHKYTRHDRSQAGRLERQREERDAATKRLYLAYQGIK
jgi:hypothetical protein